jgi:ATP-binding cassette subfamily B (MDR/TAP) protein 1
LQFVAGFVIAFIVNWKCVRSCCYLRPTFSRDRLSVVLLAILPTIGLAGFAMEASAQMDDRQNLAYPVQSSMSKSKSRSLELLGQAGTLAEESISSIRTVQAFNTKDRLCALYDVPNKEAEKMGRRMGVATSVGVGAFFWIIYSAYALAFWCVSRASYDSERLLRM